MSLVEETLNRIVRDIVDTVIGVDGFTIKAKQNAPRPENSYSSVDIVHIKNMGWEEEEWVDRIEDPDIDFKSAGHREVMYSVQFYFDNAMTNAEQVKIGFFRNSVNETLRAANMGLVSRSDVRDISESLENGWEERAQLDIVLSALGTDEEIIRSIEIVSISGEYQERGISTPINVEV